MTKKFEIAGRPSGQPGASTTAMERFISGEEPVTTMTVQIPKRLHTALKRAAVDRETTLKDLLIAILETHFASIKQ